jgi:hypothetical protein
MLGNVYSNARSPQRFNLASSGKDSGLPPPPRIVNERGAVGAGREINNQDNILNLSAKDERREVYRLLYTIHRARTKGEKWCLVPARPMLVVESKVRVVGGINGENEG